MPTRTRRIPARASALVAALIGVFAAATEASAATCCVATGDELAAALGDAELRQPGDSTIRIRAGRMTTLAGVLGGPSWRFDYNRFSGNSIDIRGGWESHCSVQTMDPTLTVLDGRVASQVLSIDDRRHDRVEQMRLSSA
jgi:hypothetical protein